MMMVMEVSVVVVMVEFGGGGDDDHMRVTLSQIQRHGERFGCVLRGL